MIRRKFLEGEGFDVKLVWNEMLWGIDVYSFMVKIECLVLNVRIGD